MWLKRLTRQLAAVGVSAGIMGASVALGADPRLQPRPKPNIVHILVDDLGWQDIAAHKVDKKPVYETPNLDKMTRLGRRFTQAYSPAPTCAPSRSAYLMGQYPAHTGIYHVTGGSVPRPMSDNSPYLAPFYRYGMDVNWPIIPRQLKKAGYYSGHVGKWHAGGKSAGYPFPLNMGFDFSYKESRGSRHKFYNDKELWRKGDIKANFFGSWSRMKPDRLADFSSPDEDDPYQVDADGRPFDKPLDLALGFLRKHKDKPFFLNFAPYYVHGPIQTRDRTRFELYLNKMGYQFPTDPGTINKGRRGQSNPYYASMVDTVDWMVGQVLDYLEKTDDPRHPGHKLIDNTFIMISSDNGGWCGWSDRVITDNSPLRGGKSTTFEGGIRIPFIVMGPKVPAGTECHTPINMIDLYPTFLEMAGLFPDASLKLDGCNILPLMEGADEPAMLSNGQDRESLFWYFPMESHMSAVHRKGPWKLTHNYGVGGQVPEGVTLHKLYEDDNVTPLDLGEKNDLAAQYPERTAKMLAELNMFLAKAEIQRPYRSAEFKADKNGAKIPRVTKLGVDEATVWAEFEVAPEKNKIVEALFLYTLNPQLLDSTNGRREEWMSYFVEVQDGRVETQMPPGATHGVFCLRDSMGYLVRSEPLPTAREANVRPRYSTVLKNGFAYKPGLAALLKVAGQTRKMIGNDVDLVKAIEAAKLVYAKDKASEKEYCDVLRQLRAALRNCGVVPIVEHESGHELLNRFPTDAKF